MFDDLYKELKLRSNTYLKALGMESNVYLKEIFDNKIVLFLSELTNIINYSVTVLPEEYRIQDKNVSRINSLNADFHERLTFPIVFSFADGNKIVLKQRSADTSVFLKTFLLTLFPEEFYYYNELKYFSSNDFSWEIYIKEKNTNEINNNDIYLLGLLNVVLYSLRAIDMHDENVLFSIHGPIVVDTETIFHQEITRPSGNGFLRETGIAIFDSKSNLYKYLNKSSNYNWLNTYISGVKAGFNKIRAKSDLIYKLLEDMPNIKTRYLPRSTQEYFLIARNMNRSSNSNDVLLKQNKYRGYLCKTSKNETIGIKEFTTLSDCLIPTFYTYVDTPYLLSFENEKVFCFEQTAKGKMMDCLDIIVYSDDGLIERMIQDLFWRVM